jgi:phytoene synthase
MAVQALDLELESVVAGTTEPMIGEIRLAWWREALQGLDVKEYQVVLRGRRAAPKRHA